MKDRFTAERTNFQGVPGFMVCQYHDGEKIVEQFISEKAYKDFCNAVGIEPEITD